MCEPFSRPKRVSLLQRRNAEVLLGNHAPLGQRGRWRSHRRTKILHARQFTCHQFWSPGLNRKSLFVPFALFPIWTIFIGCRHLWLRFRILIQDFPQEATVGTSSPAMFFFSRGSFDSRKVQESPCREPLREPSIQPSGSGRSGLSGRAEDLADTHGRRDPWRWTVDRAGL